MSCKVAVSGLNSPECGSLKAHMSECCIHVILWLCIHAVATALIFPLSSLVVLIQGNPDMSSDFRLKEMPDGTVIFESVVSGGVFVAIQGSHGLQTNLNAMLVVSSAWLQ